MSQKLKSKVVLKKIEKDYILILCKMNMYNIEGDESSSVIHKLEIHFMP